LVIVNLYFRDCSGFPNVSLSGLSTLFDASLLELKAAVFAAFFLAPILLCPLMNHADESHLDLVTRGHMIKFEAKLRKVGKEQFNMRDNRGGVGAVDFFHKFSNSEQFENTFKEGMGLVEETANYLDGQGRADSRALDRTSAIAYATESMRLTTRLMQLASWLLLQRAIVAGEVTRDDVTREKSRVNLSEIGKGHELPGGENLPEGLVDLVAKSLRLHERILVLDKMLQAGMTEEAANENPVAQQMNRLAAAFGRG
jgi:regulator of CtrA degradation